MSNDPGKVFEQDFQISSGEHDDISLDRLRDPMGGAKGIQNICDFIVFTSPWQFFLELKSRQGNTLNFKEITDTQYLGLLKKSAKKNVIPGILVDYRDYEEVYFVHIQDCYRLREVEGKKSLHIKDVREIGLQLVGHKKRVRFTYDVLPFLKELGRVHGS